jgi:polar amino acid transport system substrate-binding protein
MNRKMYLLLSVLVALSMLLASCAPQAATEKAPAPEQAQATATVVVVLRVATEAAYPPFETVNEQTKALEGFDIDLMNAVAQKAGYKVEFQNTPFDSVLAGIATCQFDAAISAITITEDRAKQMNFSNSYINAGQIITVRTDENGITKPADLSSKTVGVQLSTTGQMEVEKIAGAKVKPYDSVDLAFQDLMNNQVDAVVADYPTTLNFVNKNKDKMKTTGDVFTNESYGIAVCNKKPEVLAAINKALDQLKSEGYLTQLENKWLAAQ